MPDTLCNTNDRVCLNFNVDEAAYSAVQLKRKAYELVAGYADDDDEEYLDGPYAEVNVEGVSLQFTLFMGLSIDYLEKLMPSTPDILTFPASTNHICHHAPTVSTLRSRRIKMMAIDLMAVIERDARLLQSVNAVQDILNNEDRIVREMGISIEKDAVQVLGEVKGKEFIRSAREIIMVHSIDDTLVPRCSIKEY